MHKLDNETRIIKWIILLPITGVILTSFILTNIFISSKYDSHELEIEALKKSHILVLKEKIKERIEHVSLLLDNNYKRELEKSKRSVKDIVDVGHTTISNIYHEYHNLPREEIFPIIDERMRNLRFFENKTGYYFIYDLKDGISISLPSAPTFVGRSVKKLIDKKGKNLFDSYGKILDEKGEGFDTWYWNKPGSKEKLEKIGYIKKFEPLNIAIGTAVYTEDLKNEISRNALNFVDNLEYVDDGYIFITNSKGTVISHKNKEIINIPLEELDEKIQKNVKEIIKKATTTNGDFIEYTQSTKLFENPNPSKKISYVKYVELLDWIIGTGLYTDELNKQIERKHQQLEEKLEDDISTIVFVSLVVTFIVIVLLAALSRKLKNIFHFYSQSLEKTNKELHNLNKELEKKVEKQVTKLRDKDIILNQQSKLAAMGEMLGNIAHQWRQPLSAISTLASGIRIQKEMNILDDKMLDSNLAGIVESTKILSNTIDDFRNFYSKDKEKHEFKMDTAITKVLSLISANLKNQEIELVFDIKDTTIKSYENELIQVLLNIFNNARDALIERKGKKFIFLNTYKKDTDLIIEIYDNAGGIKEDIIDRIFEPYFTTKFKSQGTGIGLYMTKNIVETSLKGSIEVKNKGFTHQDENYKGAVFKIVLPISI